MAKKDKIRRLQPSRSAPGEGVVKRRATKGASAKKKTATVAAKPAGAARAAKKSASAKKAAGGGKRVAGRIALTAPLAKARKLSGDLYQSAALSIWAAAIEAAPEPERAVLIQLQDAICDAADLLRDARATNPKHLQLYWVACFDRDGLPATPPHFVAAASEEEALDIWRTAFKGEYGRRKPKARLVPKLGETPGLLES
jgi:hypothetical protein